MLNRIKFLLIATLAPFVTQINTVFAVSQRSSFTFTDVTDYALTAHPNAAAVYNNEGVTFADFIANYSLDVSGLGYEKTPYNFGKDGKYRVKVLTPQVLTLLDGTGKISNGAFFNVEVVGGLVVSASIENLNTQQITYIGDEARSKADRAKAEAINAAAATALQLSELAKSEAIGTAATDATEKADGARFLAIDTANTYTDEEILKLRRISDMDLKGIFEITAIHQSNPNSPEYIGNTLADVNSYDFAMLGDYFLEVTVENLAGELLEDKETLLTLPTYSKDVNGVETIGTTAVRVSNDDKVLVRVFLKTDGTKAVKFVRKHDDKVFEAVVKTNAKITTLQDQIEAEFDEVRLWALAQFS